MNIAEVVRKLEPYAPLQIEVQCPRGHHISNTTLSVIDGQLTMRGEHSGYYRRRRALQNKPIYNFDLHPTSGWNTVQQCVNSRCSYRGYYNSLTLAVELAEAALRAHLTGHAAVHRLTT